MTPIASWLLMIALFATIFGVMNALYIDSLKQEREQLRKALKEAQPPF